MTLQASLRHTTLYYSQMFYHKMMLYKNIMHLPIVAVVSGKAGTVQVWGGGVDGVRGGVDGEAGTEGHWTAAKEMHRALANVALNMPVASGKG